MSYLFALFAVAALGLGLAKFGTVWSIAVQREREVELIFIGGEFARALSCYRAATPIGSSEYPGELAELLQDPRFPFVRRYLRRIYRDPMTGSDDWIIHRVAGRIVDIRSRSKQLALRSVDFPPWIEIGGASPDEIRYTDWVFRPEERGKDQPGSC